MEQKTGIILQIQTEYNQLTKTEKKVANYILENAESVLYMSITDLADACRVGDTSVYRFCRTMKLSGYQEFKMQLSLALAGSGKGQEAEAYEEEHADLLDRTANIDMKAIQETYRLADRSTLERVVSLMEASERIYAFGVGNSRLVAEELHNRFMRLTGKTYYIADPHIQAMTASLLKPGDLVFIVSYSGAAKDNIQVAKEAKNAGAKVVSLTHFRKSPLTAYSDEILLSGAKESPMDGGSMAAKMGQLFMVDLLYQMYYSRHRAECKVNREKTSKAVVEKLY